LILREECGSVHRARDRSDHTKTRVSYTITALSEKGNQYIRSFSKQHYHEWMTNWRKPSITIFGTDMPFDTIESFKRRYKRAVFRISFSVKLPAG
jgi:hypothetical protein